MYTSEEKWKSTYYILFILERFKNSALMLLFLKVTHIVGVKSVPLKKLHDISILSK